MKKHSTLFIQPLVDIILTSLDAIERGNTENQAGSSSYRIIRLHDP